MISDQERREVAASMRKEADNWRHSVIGQSVKIEDVPAMWRDMMHRIGLRGVQPASRIYDKLADLIDRPTAKQEHNGAYWRCTHCGAFTRKDAVVVDGLDVVPLRHCGNCGREWSK